MSSRLFRGRPVRKEEATVPLNEALPRYAEAAERAMNEGAIPSEYRERVRSYFDRLK